jgi:glycosyltransferase involved in cell wall biosynthesis
MKLALVTETFPPEINGVAMTFGVITRELCARGHQVTVYRPHRRDLSAAAAAHAEITVRGMPIPGYPLLRLGLPAGRALRRRWSADRPDLVHVATEGPLGASAISAARALDIPVTSSFHTNFHTYTRHYRMPLLHTATLWWLRRVHNRTARTFAPTPELCDELTALGFRDMAVLSRGVDTQLFDPVRRSDELRREWKATRQTPVVLHAGRVAAEKNFPLLLRAFEAMRVANPACRFVVVGDGPLRAKLQQENLHILFTGFVAREELARYYASADIYVHASLTETFGNVLTEAMASGLAVAGFDYAAARKFVQDGRTGLSAPCSEPEALISAGVRLATDPALRERVRSAARAAVEPQSWAAIISRFASDLDAVVNRTRGSGAHFALQLP